MFCRNCGKELTGNPELCLNCGARPLAGSSFCPGCGAPTSPIAEICVKCGARLVKEEKARRPAPITAASILSWVLGGFSLLGALILFPLAFLWAQILPEIPEIPEMPFWGLITPALFIALGVIALIFGALYVVAGLRLWKCKRSGGIIGIVIAALGIISSFFPYPEFGFFSAAPDIALIALIAIRWGKLSR